MKLSFSPASPFARKVRIAAIETGLIDKIEFVPATVAPGTPNDEYSKITPLKKLPVLILDNGDVVLDSYVIAEYLDELAGGGKLIPASGPTRWKVKSDHSLLQGMLDSMLLCRYERMVRPKELQVEGLGRRSLEPGLEWHGAFREPSGDAVAAIRHLADRARLRARLCRFPLCRLRLAEGLSETQRLPSEDAGAALGQDLGAARRLEPVSDVFFTRTDIPFA